jgi:hypothetical protein
MFNSLRRRVSSAHVMSAIALFVALGGTGYAAVKINGKNVRTGSLPGAALKNRTITAGKIKRDSLSGNEIAESTLGIVPSAAAANTANTANSATTANTANSATTASNVGGRTAASLQVQCPADTAAAGGVCIELTQRAAASWPQASVACGARGLPNLSQLVSFLNAHQPLSGTEWASDVFDESTVAQIEMSTGVITGGKSGTHPYRCMTTPSN